MNSKLFNLNFQDVAKAFVVFLRSAFLTSISSALSQGAFPTLAELKQAGIVSLTAAISYLIKNFITNSAGQIGKEAN